MTGKNILVVDDSAVMRQMTSALLEEAGYAVLLAEDGQTALQHLERSQVDLVLTDWTMIPMDGGELTRRLRQLEAHAHAHVPVVVLSTISSEAGKAEARAAGANGWLCKPVRPETLLDAMDSLLALRQA